MHSVNPTKDEATEVVVDDLSEMMKELEKKSEEILKENDIVDELKAVHDIEFPSDTSVLRALLIVQYNVVKDCLMKDKDNVLYHPYWEIWSGRFNRHIRAIQKTDISNHKNNQYHIIFQTWSSCHHLLQEYGKHRLLRKTSTINRHVKMVKGLKEIFVDSVTKEKSS